MCFMLYLNGNWVTLATIIQSHLESWGQHHGISVLDKSVVGKIKGDSLRHRHLLDVADSDEAWGNGTNTYTYTHNLRKFRRSVYQCTSLRLTFIEEENTCSSPLSWKWDYLFREHFEGSLNAHVETHYRSIFPLISLGAVLKLAVFAIQVRWLVTTN